MKLIMKRPRRNLPQRSPRYLKAGSGWLLAVCLLAINALAQSSSASLTGVVTDPSGNVVPGASVTLTSLSTAQTRMGTTDAQGRYTLSQLAPGLYRLTAQQTGFATTKIENIELRVNTPTTLNVGFGQLSAVTETVTVSSEATQLNTSDVTVGNAFDSRPILQLPMNARNPAGLLSLQTGVTFMSAEESDGRFRDHRNGAINGAKADQSNVTLDGVDVNDQQNRWAFTSVLRNTLDSIQEFRVTTVNANADQGRGSGAQVALVTKSGTNQWHGSAYEFHRNTATAANDFFNNAACIDRARLIRNVFGASAGGPVIKDRLFIFGNYEGRRDASEGSAVREVPTADFRNGIVSYPTVSGGVAKITPARLKQNDPLGIGINAAAAAYFKAFPLPNDNSVGDGFNTAGFRFNASTPLRWNTYIARLDYNPDRAGRHTLFARGNLQNDKVTTVPFLPGHDPESVQLNNSKGIAAGWNHVLKNNLVGNFRYGLTRQGVETAGAQKQAFVWLTLQPLSRERSLAVTLPVHNFSEDLTWTRGAHTIQFGGAFRSIRNRRNNTENSFHTAYTLGWMMVGQAAELRAGLNDVHGNYAYDLGQFLMGQLGIVNYVAARYNYDKQGGLLPQGGPVRRNFGQEEGQLYVQDTWRVTRGLTITGGLRWNLMPPVREVNGVQTTVNIDYEEFVNKRVALANAGQPQSLMERISFAWADSAQGKPLYPFYKNNFAPRLSFSWSPQAGKGWLAKLTGGTGKTTVRGGAGLYYDLFGMSIMKLLDGNSFGLSTEIINPAGVLTASTAPRFTGVYNIPSALLTPAPKGGPGTPPDNFAATDIVDHKIRAPYSLTYSLSVGRELPRGFFVEASYVGRVGRRLLIGDSGGAQQVNFRDPKSGQRLFDAAGQLEMLARAGTPVGQIRPIPFWENLYSKAAGNGLNATQAVYSAFVRRTPDVGGALSDLDTSCAPACSDLGPYTFYIPQFWYLGAWRSVGSSDYHSGQLTLRKRFGNGFQFDVNYTLSKSLDLASYPERGWSGPETYGSLGWIINSWDPGAQRAVSDFDLRHQLNANWVAELPFGKGRKFLSNANALVDAALGGWQVSGIWRQTSGFPLNVNNGPAWPTNWCCAHAGTIIGPIPAQTNTKNGLLPDGKRGPNVFDDPQAALKAFRQANIGEVGTRNALRADGLFSVDLGIGKRFRLPVEGHSLQLRAEAFNLTNSVSFNVNFNAADLGSPAEFGKYSRVLVPARVWQFGLRYEF